MVVSRLTEEGHYAYPAGDVGADTQKLVSVAMLFPLAPT